MQLAQTVLGVTIRGDSEHQGEGGLVSGHHWVKTNLALLKQQRPVWRVGDVQGGGGEGQPGPVASAVQAGPLNLVMTGEGGITIPP